MEESETLIWREVLGLWSLKIQEMQMMLFMNLMEKNCAMKGLQLSMPVCVPEEVDEGGVLVVEDILIDLVVAAHVMKEVLHQ